MLSSLIVCVGSFVFVVRAGNSVLSVKSISFGIFRCVFHDHPVLLVILVPSIDVATDEFGELAWYFFITAEYLDVPEFVEPKDPVGLNFFANCGLYVNSADVIAPWIDRVTCEIFCELMATMICLRSGL